MYKNTADAVDSFCEAGKRNAMTASTFRLYSKTTDEIRRLDKKNLLVFVRDQNVIEIRKMDYTENPIYKANQAIFVHEVSVADHVTMVEKVDVNYDSFRFSDIDRSRFVSNISGRAEEKPKTEPEQHRHEPTEYTPFSLAPEVREGFDISAVVCGQAVDFRL